MSDPDTSLKAAFQALEAERARTWPTQQLASNIAQRRDLIARFDSTRSVRVGDQLADAELVDPAGGGVSLDRLVAPGLAVLIFFRFATCPADILALPHYDRHLRPELERLGVPLVAISPQIPEKLVEIVDRHVPSLRVLSDPDNRLATRLGITFAPDDRPAPPPAGWIGSVTGTGSWDLPMPTVLILDRERVVRFVSISPDWLDRPEASDILAAAAALRARNAERARDAA